jgi:glycosyltransferase involved in cell wall biosynthesis
MDVIYADPGLIGEAGHHANSCRDIVSAFRDRGHAVTIAANHTLPPDLIAELGAKPVFRASTYERLDHDPVAGWLFSYYAGAASFAQDLTPLTGPSGTLGPDTLIYVNSIQPTQLMGVRTYLLSLPAERRPIVFAEFGQEPGVDYREHGGKGQFEARDPRIDPRATLYRFTGRAIAGTPLPQLHLCTFDRDSSRLYELLLNRSILTLPVPRFRDVRPTRRATRRPLTITMLGHQRAEKGYEFAPEIMRLLLAQRADIRFLVHCADPALVPVQHERVCAMADSDPRIALLEGPATQHLWQDVLDQSDIILCPYNPKAFRAGYSAVTSEAFANAVPVVVPANTTLARMMTEFGGAGVAFETQNPEDIVRAVGEAVDRADDLAERAMGAAQQWRTTMGAGAMVDAVLAHLPERLRARAPAMAY